ncbi:hypothetical protein, partial [Salmonella enterica]|uniref:hypothetical protein n=1 Tax=Salmonella enterica TaxID=28901 RepID=UPI00398C4EC5
NIQHPATVVLDNLPRRALIVRMVVVIPESTTDTRQNKMLWSSHTEIIQIRQGYPATAAAGLWVAAGQFGLQQHSAYACLRLYEPHHFLGERLLRPR